MIAARKTISDEHKAMILYFIKDHPPDTVRHVKRAHQRSVPFQASAWVVLGQYICDIHDIAPVAKISKALFGVIHEEIAARMCVHVEDILKISAALCQREAPKLISLTYGGSQYLTLELSI
jgi:hypothetical protein